MTVDALIADVIALTVDGVMGPRTREVLAATDAGVVARVVWQELVRYLAHVAMVRPTTSARRFSMAG